MFLCFIVFVLGVVVLFSCCSWQKGCLPEKAVLKCKKHKPIYIYIYIERERDRERERERDIERGMYS